MLRLLIQWQLKVTTNNSRKSQQCLIIFTRLTLTLTWNKSGPELLKVLTYWEFIINFKSSEFWFLKFSVLSLSLNLGHVSCWSSVVLVKCRVGHVSCWTVVVLDCVESSILKNIKNLSSKLTVESIS
jgi:hypothetical protein